MANAVTAWDQRPEFLAYSDWTPIPGITSYAVPRKGTGTDVTQFHPGQAFLSEHNLPDIMYQLHPCKEWKRFRETPLPGQKMNVDGSPVYEQYTRPGHQRQVLLDFKILPDKISTEEGWWYCEFVRRIDPRIRQRDIIMRQEPTAERLRMSDQKYINIHLNTPGYRVYRPAWKMLSWHATTGEDSQNRRKELVLDSLTDAQKRANTTRGSTPGLINPALGDIPGNRISLPEIRLRKTRPKYAAPDADNSLAAQTAQYLPVPQAQQVSQGSQIHQTRLPSQALHSHQNQQFSRSSRVSSTASAAAPRQNSVRGYTSAQACDRTAMPPPPRPLDSRNDRSRQPQVLESHPGMRYATIQQPRFDGSSAKPEEMEDVMAINDPVPRSEHSFMSDEEIATMSAKSDAAMAEILWMCEPLLGPYSNIQDPPPMDLSAELIDYLGVGFLFSNQEAGNGREIGNEDAMPRPARTMQVRKEAVQKRPMLAQKQGTKRKEHHKDKEDDEYNSNFQQAQLDVERREIRPVKRVKSIHNADLHNPNGAFDEFAAKTFQRHPHHLQPGDLHSGAIHGQTFDWLTPQATQSPQHAFGVDFNPCTGGFPYEELNGSMVGKYPNHTFGPCPPETLSTTKFPDYILPHKAAASPFQAASTTREENLSSQSSILDHGVSAGILLQTSPIDQALEHQFFDCAPHRQQLGDGYSLQLEGTPVSQVEDLFTPEVVAALLGYSSPSNFVSNDPLDPLFEAFINNNATQ